MFLIGLIINFLKEKNNNKDLLQFDYSRQDSMFYNDASASVFDDSTEKIIEKGVDSNRELLDFNTAKIVKNSLQNSGLPVDIIEINNATVVELESLPGIGKKTAEAVIEYRTLNGKFQKVEDLMNVKGIGKAKLEKIKKYIVVK